MCVCFVLVWFVFFKIQTSWKGLSHTGHKGRERGTLGGATLLVPSLSGYSHRSGAGSGLQWQELCWEGLGITSEWGDTLAPAPGLVHALA